MPDPAQTGEPLFLPHPRRCSACGFPRQHCYCASIPRVPCRTRVVIVRHRSERYKASNTGGLTSVVLGATRIDHGLEGPALDLTGQLGETPRLLLPHGSRRLDEPPSCLVVLDGTWSQVRSMRSRIAPLPQVPVLTVAEPAPRERMRRAHTAQGQSTMEAVADALELLGEPEPAAALRDLYDELVRRWLWLRLGRGTVPS